MHDKVSLSKKTIAELESDVLFNYTNTDFIPKDGGSHQAILSADPDIVRETAHTNLRVGQAVLRGPGKLSYKMICHCAVSGMGNDPTEMSIRNALRWGFQLVAEQRHTKCVIPALNEDGGGMPLDLCAEVLLREAFVFAEYPFVEKVVIQTSAKEYPKYAAVLKRLLGK